MGGGIQELGTFLEHGIALALGSVFISRESFEILNHLEVVLVDKSIFLVNVSAGC